MPFNLPQSTCRICCASFGVETLYHRELGICGRCAEAAANMYSKAHSGDWFTWSDTNGDTDWKRVSDVTCGYVRDAEVKRLKRLFFECMNDGQFELAEAYHAKLIEMEVGR